MKVPPLRRILIASCAAIALLATLAAPAGSAAASNWTLRQLPPRSGDQWGPPLSGVSCPTESLCVAVGGLNTLAFSQAPTGGAGKWRVVGPPYPVGPGKTCVEGEPHCPEPGGRLQAVSCASQSLCVAVGYEGFIYVSTDPTGGADAWSPTVINEGDGATHLTAVSCPSLSFCAAVSGGSNNSNGGKVLTSTNPTGGAGSWHFENLVAFRPTENGKELEPPRNALFSASCASTSLCVLVGIDGRIFTATDPFSAPDPPPGQRRRKAPCRPHTIIVFAEHFWKLTASRRRHIGARFRFYSPTRTSGFECMRDRGPYRPCRSPLRYRVTHGRHALRVRAIGPTGLRGPAAIKHFRVLAPTSR